MSTVSDVCNFAGISEVTFYNLKKRGVIKSEKRGEYDIRECVRAMIKDGQAAKGGHGDHASAVTLSNARAELARVQREAIEWKNAVNRGDYVSADAVIRRLQDDFAVQRTLLLSWIGKLPSQLEGLSAIEIEVVLERELYEVLDELANPAIYVGRAHAVDADDDQPEVDSGVQGSAKAKTSSSGRTKKERSQVRPRSRPASGA